MIQSDAPDDLGRDIAMLLLCQLAVSALVAAGLLLARVAA